MNVSQISKRITQLSHQLPQNIKDWVIHTEKLATSIIINATGPLSRLQLDALTSASSNIELRQATLKILGDYVSSVLELESPTQKIQHLVNIPEAILQAISGGFCDINFIDFQNNQPHAPYNDFFSNTELFKLPTCGSKLALTSLLVIIPAILSLSPRNGCEVFTNKTLIKPQQQKLVECVRNPASHTVVAFLEKDARFLCELCISWLSAWCKMEGYDSFECFSQGGLTPNSIEISSIILD